MTHEEAIRYYRWLVEAIARNSVRPGLDRDDLVQEGFFGLLRAANEWRPDGGASFATLANARIRNAIRDYERSIAFEDRIGDCSLDSYSGDAVEDGLSLHDVFGAPPEQEDVVARHEKIDAVREGLSVLSSKDRELMRCWAESLPSNPAPGQPDGVIPEMARAAGVPRKTMDDRVRAARRRLERQVAPFVDQTVRVAS